VIELHEVPDIESDEAPIQDVPDPSMLLDLGRMPMPFGRYQGRKLIDLPEPYVVWFRKQGFPRGRLGLLFGLLYEIKANGLEHLVPRPGEVRAPPARAPAMSRSGDSIATTPARRREPESKP
jgi:uncharacterized protein (DUF3820 family)